jgi:hypothetical protein
MKVILEFDIEVEGKCNPVETMMERLIIPSERDEDFVIFINSIAVHECKKETE